MIPRNWAPGQAYKHRDATPAPTDAPRAASAWQMELQAAVRDVAELARLLHLPAHVLESAAMWSNFPLRVPRGFISRMNPGDIDDPLLRQVLPLAAEMVTTPGYFADPVGDRAALASPGLIHKYHGRALLIATGACAIHCRYCFRREFPYTEQGALGANWPTTLDRIAAMRDVNEIILSGGDPLLLTDERIATIAGDLTGQPHLRRLRIHTRLPIVLPSRVTDELLSALTRHRLTPVIVIHCNHPRELNVETAEALARLRSAGITLLNQTVLLRGVNDSAQTLEHLSTRLFEQGVLPYYLHLLDRVQGAAHFDVAEETAREIHATLENRLPGYLVPNLVREIAGAPAKTRIR